MARVYYERLSPFSEAMLDRESERNRAHTAMILVFDGGPFARPDGGIDFERLREIVAARLPELPRLRSRLQKVPVDGQSVWVDDLHFNLDYHLRQSSLPRPGDHDQLCRTAARIAASKLDRSRPLWDCWVLEGVEGGRFALVLKMHKALAHLEGADLLRAMLSPHERDRTPPGGRLVSRPAPAPVELFAREVLRRWAPARRAVRRVGRLARRPRHVNQAIRKRGEELLDALGYRLRVAGETPFDGSLSPHRAFSVEQVDLESARQMRATLGGSIHDVVLTILTGALRRFLEERRISPHTVDLRAVTPILEVTGQSAEPWVIDLPVWEATVEARHAVVVEQTRRCRVESDVAPAESLLRGDEWTAGRLFMLGARVFRRLATGQVAVLQSPISRRPLYLDGARLVECYGILPLQASSALGITVLSYDGSLFYAFNVDPDIVGDVRRLRDALDTEVAAMLALIGERRAPALRAVVGGD